MADHGSGPRAFADPVVDITDMYVFPSPERPGWLVLVLNVFPFAGPSALFSDAVDYRFRVRAAEIAARGPATAFAVSDKEYTFSCRFAPPVNRTQAGVCTASTGQSISVLVNDERGGSVSALRVFTGLRLDPFFLDVPMMLETLRTGRLAFNPVGTSSSFRQNVLSIVVELDIAAIFGAGHGALFAVVGETVAQGPMAICLERFGRPEIKNAMLLPNAFDTVNRNIELRDLYNQEDAFKLGRAYLGAFRARMNANLAFYDGLDGKIDWPVDANGVHPLTELLLQDFMIVDVTKPYSEESYFEIERTLLKGAAAPRTCGGRSLNEDTMDVLLTLLINAGNGPRIRDGVDGATVPASRVFPYLATPEPNPPKAKSLLPR